MLRPQTPYLHHPNRETIRRLVEKGNIKRKSQLDHARDVAYVLLLQQVAAELRKLKWGKKQDKLEEMHVLFMQNNRDGYIDKLFARNSSNLNLGSISCRKHYQ